MSELEPFPQDWQRALVVMAHPDDPEYGVAAAVAQWTAAGKDVGYLLATRGEAGIAGMNPAEAGPLRAEEQRQACSHVGVHDLRFLDLPDGRLEEGPQLRRLIAREIRRQKPALVITLNHRDTWRPGAWNSSDHRVLGRSVLDAAADAGNEWIFPELLAEGLPAHRVQWVAVASTEPSHSQRVDSASVGAAVASLTEHRRYLEALSDVPVLEQATAQVDMVTSSGQVRFELFG
ncbi:PIG-L family deacetylase [Paenarthrobacter sp. PH39-S1]|uniref:PIG-L deacetylase family protein n=1 Tax=Paenarthrobacter sp. PH39-S1 TaxID=3046204 RepID=UPI0024B9169E|nr:PIG-L family deacetylase [Paenarthrobacter sp. PH39-S1]MDJ0355386.1 PIG-L family deacetylase [Paenarthrobacter sp. PH39-S1]